MEAWQIAMKQADRIRIIMAVGFVAGGCASDDGTATRQAFATQFGDFETYRENQIVDEPELTFTSLSELVPGFAGYFFDGDGNLVVRLTDLRLADRAIQLVSELPVATEPSRDGGSPLIIIDSADFAITDLYGWRMTIRRALMDAEGVVSLGINVRANRLRVGVLDLDARLAAESVLDSAGVPKEAVLFFEVDWPTRATHTLQSSISPRIGGIQGKVDGGGLCTIGFTARNASGLNGFFSASHCSPEMWSVDSSLLYQPTLSGTPLGFESADPSPWICGLYSICRDSDASFWTRSSGVTSTLGRVARTTWYNGSIHIDHSNPYFTVTGEKSPTEGMQMDHMGRVSGWNYGVVTDTCCDLNFGDGTRIPCLIQSSNQFTGGDSGGPVFFWPVGTNNIRLMGLISAIQGANGYSSRISRIRSDFGNITTY